MSSARKFASRALASLSAFGLAAAVPVSAQAAPDRSASPVVESEELAGSWLLYALLIGAAIAAYIVISDDNDDTDGLPASP